MVLPHAWSMGNGSHDTQQSRQARFVDAPRGGVAPTDDPIKVVLYSHDSQGLGHVRRNLALAHRLAQRLPELTGRKVTGLLVTGLAQASRFPLPDGFDWLALPSLTKGDDGYEPRNLDTSMSHLVDLRSDILGSTLLRFAPDLFIIDRHAYGVRRELRRPLRKLRKASPRTRVVLGLREVLDDPRTAAAEWERLDKSHKLRRLIDQVWVYGDESVHNPLATGEVPFALADRVRFTGYLAHGRGGFEAHEDDEALEQAFGLAAPRPYVLTTVGGGSDGSDVIEAAVTAEVPEGYRHLVVTGPQMPEELAARAEELAGPGVIVRRVVDRLSCHMASASAVITMGGYNSVCEVLATDTPALVVPRETPRTEQLIRAQGMADAGLLDVLRTDDLTPEALGDWMRTKVGTRTSRSAIARDGLEQAAHYAADLVVGNPVTTITPARAPREDHPSRPDGGTATVTRISAA